MAAQIQTSASIRGEGIDARRACSILGIGYRTLQRLGADGVIEWFNPSQCSWKRVRYYSIVEFCDRLRQEYRITDRRPTLSAPYVRHRDEDLLPFPLRDTLGTEEALDIMGLSVGNRGHRFGQMVLEEWRFEAYQLIPQSPWRVSRLSLLAYMDSASKPQCNDRDRYKVPQASIHF